MTGVTQGYQDWQRNTVSTAQTLIDVTGATAPSAGNADVYGRFPVSNFRSCFYTFKPTGLNLALELFWYDTGLDGPEVKDDIFSCYDGTLSQFFWPNVSNFLQVQVRNIGSGSGTYDLKAYTHNELIKHRPKRPEEPLINFNGDLIAAGTSVTHTSSNMHFGDVYVSGGVTTASWYAFLFSVNPATGTKFIANWGPGLAGNQAQPPFRFTMPWGKVQLEVHNGGSTEVHSYGCVMPVTDVRS